MTSLDEQRAFWDSWTDRLMDQVSPEGRARGAYILKTLSRMGLRDLRILEVGCAEGWLCAELTRFGHVTGIDLSDVAVQAARTRVPEGTFYAGSFTDIDFGDAKFDLIICCESIAYMDQVAFVRKCASILDRGGYVIVTTPNWPMWTRNGRSRASPSYIKANHLSMEQLRALLLPSFDIVKATTLLADGSHGIERIVNSYKLNAFLRLFMSNDRLDAIKGRFGFGQTLFIMGRLRE